MAMKAGHQQRQQHGDEQERGGHRRALPEWP